MPQSGRPRRLHAFSAYEPILDLANDKVRQENYLDLAFGFLRPSNRTAIEVGILQVLRDPPAARGESPRARSPFPIPHEVIRAMRRGQYWPKPEDTVESVLRGCYRLAGQAVDRNTVEQLGLRVRQVLARYLDGEPDSLQQDHFVMTSRRRVENPHEELYVDSRRLPLQRPVLERAPDGGFDPDTNDLQDIWFGFLSSLLASLANPEPVILKRRGRRIELPSVPLLRCLACPRFFFRTEGQRQRTCSRPCSKLRSRRPGTRSPTPPRD